MPDRQEYSYKLTDKFVKKLNSVTCIVQKLRLINEHLTSLDNVTDETVARDDLNKGTAILIIRESSIVLPQAKEIHDPSYSRGGTREEICISFNYKGTEKGLDGKIRLDNIPYKLERGVAIGRRENCSIPTPAPSFDMSDLSMIQRLGSPVFRPKRGESQGTANEPSHTSAVDMYSQML